MNGLQRALEVLQTEMPSDLRPIQARAALDVAIHGLRKLREMHSGEFVTCRRIARETLAAMAFITEEHY